MAARPYIRFCRTREMVAAAKRLERLLFKDDDPYDPQDGLWWLAFDEEGPCAFACMRHMPDHAFAFLARCGVRARARGKGLQKAFIKLRERKARTLGCNQMITYTTYENHASANSLISAGYRLYFPTYRYGTRYALYFAKDLKP